MKRQLGWLDIHNQVSELLGRPRPHMNPDEKRIAAKQCLEAKYTRVNKLKEDREMRKQNLRAKMEEMQLDPEKQQEAEALHDRNETEHLRAQRLKLTVQDFEQLDIIGRGACGEVRLCREKTSRNIYARKKLRKAEMVLKGQVHLRRLPLTRSLSLASDAPNPHPNPDPDPGPNPNPHPNPHPDPDPHPNPNADPNPNQVQHVHAELEVMSDSDD